MARHCSSESSLQCTQPDTLSGTFVAYSDDTVTQNIPVAEYDNIYLDAGVTTEPALSNMTS